MKKIKKKTMNVVHCAAAAVAWHGQAMIGPYKWKYRVELDIFNSRPYIASIIDHSVQVLTAETEKK